MDAQVSGGKETEVSFERAEPYLYAVGEKEPVAEWQFRQTPAVDLVGMRHLTIVVRVPRETDARMSFGGILRYRATSAPDEPYELTIPGV